MLKEDYRKMANVFCTFIAMKSNMDFKRDKPSFFVSPLNILFSKLLPKNKIKVEA